MRDSQLTSDGLQLVRESNTAGVPSAMPNLEGRCRAGHHYDSMEGVKNHPSALQLDLLGLMSLRMALGLFPYYTSGSQAQLPPAPNSGDMKAPSVATPSSPPVHAFVQQLGTPSADPLSGGAWLVP